MEVKLRLDEEVVVDVALVSLVGDTVLQRLLEFLIGDILIQQILDIVLHRIGGSGRLGRRGVEEVKASGNAPLICLGLCLLTVEAWSVVSLPVVEVARVVTEVAHRMLPYLFRSHFPFSKPQGDPGDPCDSVT